MTLSFDSDIIIANTNKRGKGYVYYQTHNLTHSDKETRIILNKLFSLFEVVDTAGADCLHALPSSVSDFEDAVMVETAKRINADCIITRNAGDYKASGIKIYLPKEFARELQAEK